jgi:hypothetical protein
MRIDARLIALMSSSPAPSRDHDHDATTAPKVAERDMPVNHVAGQSFEKAAACSRAGS